MTNDIMFLRDIKLVFYAYSSSFSYSRLMTRYPWVLIIIDIVLVAVCGPVAYYLHGIPSFEDPIKVI